MNGIYKLIVSGIDGNGFQYISGMLEPERLDSNGFRIGKAFSVEIYHGKMNRVSGRSSGSAGHRTTGRT